MLAKIKILVLTGCVLCLGVAYLAVSTADRRTLQELGLLDPARTQQVLARDTAPKGLPVQHVARYLREIDPAGHGAGTVPAGVCFRMYGLW
ncbi:MAG: hypothetical protein HPY54_13650 [Chthonomonadetes bacterium]|nr:hypothetical protein [Chthonomonadetes bacterium]